ncbi:MAG TPA: ornithine cyclodeaminase family protein [Hyphomonadaceae bacterium]|jgi:ornithine cyclodeaminase|nr:ornithine cyclodeaminase family protein [Hyphomonadaceae bacterium]
MAKLVVFDAEELASRLSIADCIPLVRRAMIALSDGSARQLLRSFISMGDGRTFAQMPAALGVQSWFGAKLVSVFADPADPGHKAHKGLVILFDGPSGDPLCVADAGEVTRIRTAAATALATDILARKEASILTIMGSGLQAKAHVEAIKLVRDLKEIRIWARTMARARDLADELNSAALPVRAVADGREAAQGADIICTVTSSPTPVLLGDWVGPGTHVNLVGSSAPVPVETDSALVTKSRFIADHREHVLAHGAEFLTAKRAGLVDESHVIGEIGEVLIGKIAGRQSLEQVTVYKSLGHAVQDLAAVAWLYEQSKR